MAEKLAPWEMHARDLPCRGGCGKLINSVMPTWCKECGEREDRKYREAKEAEVRRERERSARTELPRRFAGWVDLNDPKTAKRVVGGGAKIEQLRAALESLAADECSSVVLSGPAGVGKTVSACAMLRAWILSGREGRYFAALDLANARRDNKYFETPQALDRAITAHLLVIDDVGQETLTEGCRASLREVVWTRYDDGRPTIFTTAQTQDWILQAHGDGFARRMYEGAIEITWPWGSK